MLYNMYVYIQTDTSIYKYEYKSKCGKMLKISESKMNESQNNYAA